MTTILKQIIEKNKADRLQLENYYGELYKKDIKSQKQDKLQWFYSSFFKRKPIDVYKKIQQDFFFLCECKKASPSKGVIRQNYNPLELAIDYEKASSDGISVLTEKYFFQGNINHLKEIRQRVKLPLLRKDFIVSKEQIFEAYENGADIVLLIVSCLSTQELIELKSVIEMLGMTALVEIHNEEELEKALIVKSKLIGINNRNLNTFETSLNVCLELRKKIPKEILVIAESGIKTREDILLLKEKEFNGVLIGESILVQADTKKAIEELKK